MSRRWKKSLSYLVLFSFLALLTPKSVWHDCVHQHENSGLTAKKELQDKAHFTQGFEKCAVCDLHIPQLANPLSELRFTGHFVFQSPPFSAAAEITLEVNHSHFLRGPPVLA